MSMKKELAYKATEVERVIYSYLPKNDGYQKTIFSAMNYAMQSGGKRLRPILMNETFKLFGGSTKAIEPFMTAMEMIHNYSLIHDDLPAMDNDLLRHGKPSTHAVYGEAMGILAGDALLNYAYEIALKSFDLDKDVSRVVSALRILTAKAGIYGMVGGQVVDVESEKSQGISRDQIDFIYRLKTGALIEASMMIGAILAGATQEQISVIEDVASKIGMAFQIQDDILDIEGDEATIGKPVGSDEKNQKATFVTFAGIEKSKEEVKRLTDEALSELNSLPYNNPFLDELLAYLVYREN